MSQLLFGQEVLETPLAQPANPWLIEGVRPRPLRILMVCSLYLLPYRVMRCAAAAGAEVYVLGNEGSKGFRYSLCPKKFVLSPVQFNGTVSDEVLNEINRYVVQFNVDLVIPGDAPSTRVLCGLKDRVAAPCFPMPDLTGFDTLNDKWAFAGICRELDIPCPPMHLFESKEELLRALEADAVTLPAICKPLSMDGNHGIVKLDATNAREQAEAINYSPIIVQDFIVGEDIGASIYCEGGVVRSYILHRLKDRTYTALEDARVQKALEKIAAHKKIDGVYNFDMRLTDDGRIYYLECNPRFFYKINLSMLTGINFVQAGLPGMTAAASVAPGTRVRLQKAIAQALLKPWTLIRNDFVMLTYTLADPLAYLRELLGLAWEK